ncbi:polysaccharide lyase family 8 protein [Peniophora sp. CONT]|nr:polysaccharide lyase family 8 protein [Peniophora sp. CONT]
MVWRLLRSTASALLVLYTLSLPYPALADADGQQRLDHHWGRRTSTTTSSSIPSSSSSISSPPTASSSASTPTTTLNATEASDLETILSRRLTFAIRSAGDASNVGTWLDSLSVEGTWPDVDYTAGCPAQRANWPAEDHWARIVTLAAAWKGGLPGGDEWVGDADVEAGFLSAMDYWFGNDFNNTDCLVFGGDTTTGDCTCDTPGLWNTNWYSNVIGVPTFVGQACVLANSTLDGAQLDSCNHILGRSFEVFFNASINPAYSNGANGLLLAAIGVDYALMSNNVTVMEETYQQVDKQLVLVPQIKTDGIKPDGSFGQHGGLLYTGNYGKDFANNVMALEIEAGGTEFAANETGIEAFETFWEGNMWMVVCNTVTKVLHWDLSVVGRMISFPVFDNQATASLKMNLTDLLALGELWNSTILQSVYHDLETNVTSANAGDLIGNRVFPDNDYVVQRGENYVTTLKMYSDRTLNTECVNSENPLGFHLADFTLYTYVNGDEYEDIAGGWDWNLIPGTTVDYGHTPLDCADASFTGLQSFVGGVSTGEIGAAAMKYTNPFTLDLSWNKAIFFLPDDKQVVMVNNITSSSNASVVSVLDQRRHTGEVHVDGRVVELGGNEDEGREEFEGAISLWHGGNGYVFDESMPAALTVSVGQHPANWTEIGISQVQDTVDLFAAYLNHTDLSKPLQYTVYPGVDRGTFEWKSRSRWVETVVNDGDVSAVWDGEYGILSAVFWSESGGEVDFGRHRVEVDGNVAVIVDVRARTLTVADPSQLLPSVNIRYNGRTHTIDLPTDPLAVGTSVMHSL